MPLTSAIHIESHFITHLLRRLKPQLNAMDFNPREGLSKLWIIVQMCLVKDGNPQLNAWTIHLDLHLSLLSPCAAHSV